MVVVVVVVDWSKLETPSRDVEHYHMFTASRSPGVRPRVTFSTSGSSYFHVPLTTVRHLLNVCTAKNWRQGMSTYRDFLLRNVYMKELINWNSHQLYPPAFFFFFS